MYHFPPVPSHDFPMKTGRFARAVQHPLAAGGRRAPGGSQQAFLCPR